MGGGLHIPPEKLWRILCISSKCLYLHNYMANSAIILYLGFLVDLIYHIEKLGRRDLNKKLCKNLQNTYLKLLLINHQAYCNEI